MLKWERKRGEEGRAAKSSHCYYRDSYATPPVMESERGDKRERDKEKNGVGEEMESGITGVTVEQRTE